MATYRAICDIWLPNNTYAQAGDIISDVAGAGVPIPVGWTPCLGVDPQDSAAQQAFFNAGPGSSGQAEHGALSTVFAGNRWSGINVAAPQIYWKPAVQGGVSGFVLHGAEGLGFKS
jgi:hypothetical protein